MTLTGLDIYTPFLFCFVLCLFLAVLGLRCCAWAFSSCSKQGLLFIAVCKLPIVVASLVAEHRLQAHRLQQLWHVGSRAQAQQLWHTGLVAPWHVGSSWARDRTHVPCIGRQFLNRCATREALYTIYMKVMYDSVISKHLFYDLIISNLLCLYFLTNLAA